MILGVTGGIASGKSTVTRALADLGAVVVSADELAREVVRPGSPILARLAQRFGREILLPDGNLNRKALAALVFTDARARSDLNGIIHPAIAELSRQRLRGLQAERHSLIVYEAPLLFEAGAEDRVDAVLAVTVREELQLQRLIDRDGLSPEEARARIAAQMPQQEKAARADYVIDNSGPPEETRLRIRTLFAHLTAGGPPPGSA